MTSEKQDTTEMNGTETEMPHRHPDTARMGEEPLSTSEKEQRSRELEQAGSKLNQIATFPKEIERRVRRKLDWNIMPLITVVYMLSVLDRSNIGNARIAGMQQDLNLTGNKYQWFLTIFYIPCIYPPSPRVASPVLGVWTDRKTSSSNGSRSVGNCSPLTSSRQQLSSSGGW